MKNNYGKLGVTRLAIFMSAILAFVCLFVGILMAQEQSSDDINIETSDDFALDIGETNEDEYIEIKASTEAGTLKTAVAKTEIANTNWNPSTTTLTLSGAMISGITNLRIDYPSKNIKIILEEYNSITNVPSTTTDKTDSCIFVKNADNLTIAGSGELDITSYDNCAKNIAGIYATKSTLTIDGANVKILTHNTSFNENHGIYTKKLDVKNGANVDIEFGYSSGTKSEGIYATDGASIVNSKLWSTSSAAPDTLKQQLSYGIWSEGNLNISGENCDVFATSGQATKKSFGIFLNRNGTTLSLQDGAKLTATSNYATENSFGVRLQNSSKLSLSNNSLLSANNTLDGWTGEKASNNSYGISVIGKDGAINSEDSDIGINVGKAENNSYGIQSENGKLCFKNSRLDVFSDTSKNMSRCLESQGEVEFDNSIINMNSGQAKNISECIMMTKDSSGLTFTNGTSATLTASDAAKQSRGIVSKGNKSKETGVYIKNSNVAVVTGDVSGDNKSESIGIAANEDDGTDGPTLTIYDGSNVSIFAGNSTGFSDGINFKNSISVDGEKTSLLIATGEAADSTYGILLYPKDTAKSSPSITFSNSAKINCNAGKAGTSESAIYAKNASINFDDGLNISAYVDPEGSAPEDNKVNIGVTPNSEKAQIIIEETSNNALINCYPKYAESNDEKIISIIAIYKDGPAMLFKALMFNADNDKSAEDNSWTWDSKSLTLTLNGATIHEEGFLCFDVDSSQTANVVVSDNTENFIYSWDTPAITVCVMTSGNLNFSGGGSLGLISNSSDLDITDRYAIFADALDGGQLDITIGDNVEFNMTTGNCITDFTTYNAGIRCDGNINVKDNAKVNSNVGNAYYANSLVTTGDVNISGKAELNLSTEVNEGSIYASSIAAGIEEETLLTHTGRIAKENTDGKINFEGGVENYTITNCVESPIEKLMTQADFSTPLTIAPAQPGEAPSTALGQTETGDCNYIWVVMLIVAAGAVAIIGRYAYKMSNKNLQ